MVWAFVPVPKTVPAKVQCSDSARILPTVSPIPLGGPPEQAVLQDCEQRKLILPPIPIFPSRSVARNLVCSWLAQKKLISIFHLMQNILLRAVWLFFSAINKSPAF